MKTSKLLTVTALCLLATTSAFAQNLLATGSTWKYLDNGTDQGTAWRAPEFDDRVWKFGPAKLGYSDSPVTTVNYGPNGASKYITTYFRRTFFVANAAAISNVTANVLRDDGVVVYLNGIEAFRMNMPTGPVTAATLASTAVANADESTYFTPAVNPALLRQGANVLAVEVHQSAADSSDLGFDMGLVGNAGAGTLRGPYLNNATSTTMVVRWRSDVATNSRVRYGLSATSLTNITDDITTVSTEHEVLLTGLSPATKYFYDIGSTADTSTANSVAPYFETMPVPGANTPTRVWVIGDAGTGFPGQKDVFSAFRNATQTTAPDVWLMLGDNAYNSGTDTEYQNKVFNIYTDLFRTNCVWPCLGNHDSVSADSPTQSGIYYNIFTLPKAAEAGGLPSGTEAYYSFDHGRVHFVCLDSEDTTVTAGGAQLTWLNSDLAATTQDWIIVYFHHPPYTKGSHNSDSGTDSLGKMTAMRTKALPIMEAYGVDLCITGHSHSYERSYLLNGHYGLSTTFNSSHKLNPGSGRENTTAGAYMKPTLGPSANTGAVYSVVGSSGQISGGTLNHPAHFVSMNTLGSMLIDVNGTRMDVQFIDDTGAVKDYFTIRREAVAVGLSQVLME